MFDVGFTELLVIGVVALIVIGPERLPKVARTAGALLGRLQRYVADVKADVSRELHMEELRKMQQEVEASAKEMELTINKEASSLESSLNAAIAPPTEPAAETPPAAAEAAPEAPAPPEPATAAPVEPQSLVSEPPPVDDGQMELELDAPPGRKSA